VIEVKGDRKVEITLPDTIQPGFIEMVVVLQSVSQPDLVAASSSSHLFGFLPRRIDPLQFQRQLRDE